MVNDDHISSLPDELLHSILLRLGSTCAAARTSVLSRRWRHVWANVPDIVLVSDHDAPLRASFLDTIDAALDAHAATTVERLFVDLVAVWEADAITAGRAARWLRFAAEHVTGALILHFPMELSSRRPVAMQELDLPACGRTHTIMLKLPNAWRLRPAPAGVFTAVTDLTIYGRMEGSELTALVFRRCPCLQDLKLRLMLVDYTDISIRSDTLRSLSFCIWNSSLIEVMTPRLEKLLVSYAYKSRLSAPNLSELVWTGYYADDRHQFDNVSRSLQLLDFTGRSTVPPTSTLLLLKKFDEVDELKLNIDIPRGTTGYESFLNETSKLPKCKILNISLKPNGHGLASCMFHLLRNCSRAKKFCFQLLDLYGNSPWYSCPPSCPCHLEENHKFDGIALSSLEEVEICHFTGSLEDMKLVEILSCNATILKRLVINYMMLFDPALIKEVCENVRGICCANVKVKFNVFCRGRLVPFD